MICDYCEEGLPLYHKREADEYGMEPAQFIPCSAVVDSDKLLNIISQMISAGFSRDDIMFVRNAGQGRLTE